MSFDLRHQHAVVPDAIVAGHLCVDIIPTLPQSATDRLLQPGSLLEIGPVRLVTGGCVANTGRALHQLGIATRLLGKIGDDALGGIVRQDLARADTGLAGGLLVAPGEHTSYSVILSPPSADRTILHFPGANDTFEAGDIAVRDLAQARLFHFGYPPLMRAMYANHGAALVHMLQHAKEVGLTTSLDLAYPDPATPAGQADWGGILRAVLPSVDVFLPSLGELVAMLDPDAPSVPDDTSALTRPHVDYISGLGACLVGLGAGIVGIKVGAHGLYVRTASADRLQGAARGLPTDILGWANRDLWSTVFEARLVGTNGAGDATVAGFLMGLLRGMSLEETATAACAVGASSVEELDTAARTGRPRLVARSTRSDGGMDRKPPPWHLVWAA